ncbi:unnamed protein product, partial [Owenia fusiformis]
MMDKVEKHPKESEESWGDLLHTFTQNSTFHGIRYITETSPYILRKLVWVLIVLAAICGFSYVVVVRCTVYYSWEKTVNVEVTYTENLTFPSVTICNENAFRVSVAAKINKVELVRKHFGNEKQKEKDSTNDNTTTLVNVTTSAPVTTTPVGEKEHHPTSKNITSNATVYLNMDSLKSKTEIVGKGIIGFALRDPEIVDGIVNKALYLNGLDQHVEFNNQAVDSVCLKELDDCKLGLTLSLWIKLGFKEASGSQILHYISTGGHKIGNTGIAMYQRYDRLVVYIRTHKKEWHVTTSVEKNVWNMVAFTWSKEQDLTMYINGSKADHGQYYPLKAVEIDEDAMEDGLTLGGPNDLLLKNEMFSTDLGEAYMDDLYIWDTYMNGSDIVKVFDGYKGFLKEDDAKPENPTEPEESQPEPTVFYHMSMDYIWGGSILGRGIEASMDFDPWIPPPIVETVIENKTDIEIFVEQCFNGTELNVTIQVLGHDENQTKYVDNVISCIDGSIYLVRHRNKSRIECILINQTVTTTSHIPVTPTEGNDTTMTTSTPLNTTSEYIANTTDLNDMSNLTVSTNDTRNLTRFMEDIENTPGFMNNMTNTSTAIVSNMTDNYTDYLMNTTSFINSSIPNGNISSINSTHNESDVYVPLTEEVEVCNNVTIEEEYHVEVECGGNSSELLCPRPVVIEIVDPCEDFDIESSYDPGYDGVLGKSFYMSNFSQRLDFGFKKDRCFGNIQMCNNGFSYRFWLRDDTHPCNTPRILYTSHYSLNDDSNVPPQGVFVFLDLNEVSVHVIQDWRYWNTSIGLNPDSWNHLFITWSSELGLNVSVNITGKSGNQHVSNICPGVLESFPVNITNITEGVRFYGPTAIDEFMFWDTIVNKKRYAGTATVQYFLPMDDQVEDQIYGIGLNATVYKGAQTAPGKLQNSLYLNGINQWASLGNTSGECLGSLDLCEDGFTLAFWIKKGYKHPIEKYSMFYLSSGAQSPRAQGITVFQQSDKLNVHLKTKSRLYEASIDALKDDEWSHITITWILSHGLRLYHNGDLKHEDRTWKLLRPSNYTKDVDFVIGRPNDEHKHFGDAFIDDLNFWNIQQDETFIKDLTKSKDIKHIYVSMDRVEDGMLVGVGMEGKIVEKKKNTMATATVKGILGMAIEFKGGRGYVDFGSMQGECI